MRRAAEGKRGGWDFIVMRGENEKGERERERVLINGPSSVGRSGGAAREKRNSIHRQITSKSLGRGGDPIVSQVHGEYILEKCFYSDF